MKHVLTALAATAMLAVSQVHADTRAPAPQIIAEYDRSFIERSGAHTFGEMLDTGILRYFFTGGRNLLVLVNGRSYATTGSNLDTLPLSSIERIEVLRAESLGTLGGPSAVRGAMNLVLRNDLDGFEVRSVVRKPTREGGDAQQGSVVWGGEFGTGGHMTFGVDVFNRNEITAKSREHSRSEWKEGGSFADARNVSLSGNTVYVYNPRTRKSRSVALGAEDPNKCNPAQGYTGPLSNPPGIKSGDKGCGFAYAELAWDTASKDQKNATLNLSHPLGENADLYVDAIFTNASTAFRYAPSVDVFSFRPTASLIQAINASGQHYDPNFLATKSDRFAIGHRFTGHGNRDWITTSEEFDFSASIRGQLTNDLGYDARVSAFRFDSALTGNTFVDAKIIGDEIAAGRYDLSDPLSQDSDHLEAIAKSSVTEEENTSSEYLGARLAFDGAGPSIGERRMTWTAGVELSDVKAHRLLAFRDRDGGIRDVNGVLGSGGTSYAGERGTIGAFAEALLPVADALEVRAAGRTDEYDDIGGLRAWRLGAEYSLNDIVTLRGSWSTGDGAPAMHYLHSTSAQDHPYVSCIPEVGDPPRTCDDINYRQVTRITVGNTNLEPSRSERRSIGAGARKGPFYLIGDWYTLTTSDLPGQNFASWAMLNYPECPEGGSNCIQRTAGDITIHDSYANIVGTEISAFNTRFGAHKETDWGFLAVRGFWRYVISSKSFIKGTERRLSLPRSAVRVVSSVGRGNLTGFWAVNYRDEIMNLWGDGRFNSWIGHDLTLDWKKPFGLEKTRLTAGVYNVTDAKLSTNTAYPSATDGPRAAGWGRTLFVTLNMRF